MSFVVIPNIDGSMQKKMEFLASLPGGHLPVEMKTAINLEANKKFRENPPELEVGQLICTLDCGNNCKQYKIWKINEDTVEISLPDMVMETVQKTTLYDPEVCQDIFWAGPYGVE